MEIILLGGQGWEANGSAALLGRLQIFVDGVEGQLQPVRDPQFVKNIVEMVFYGLFANEHALRNLAVLDSLKDQTHHLTLPGAYRGVILGFLRPEILVIGGGGGGPRRCPPAGGGGRVWGP